MIKKYCDICEREIEKGLDNMLGTEIKMKKYYIRLQHMVGGDLAPSDSDALCAQCFLEKFIEQYREQITRTVPLPPLAFNKDRPGHIPVAWEAGHPTDKENENERDSKS